MSLITKTLPAGVDIPIDTIQRALYNALVINGSWTKYQRNHRAYINNTEGGLSLKYLLKMVNTKMYS